MRTIEHELGTIYVPGPEDSLGHMTTMLGNPYLAADTEDSGLHQYTADFQVRLVQFGVADQAWVLNPLFPRHRRAASMMLAKAEVVWWHNMIYDLIALEQKLGVPFAATAAKSKDTAIYSRLIDPRGRDKGGVGHKLEEQSAHWLGTDSKKTGHNGLKGWAAANKVKVADMWGVVPVDLYEYLLYAGQDVMVGSRLAACLDRKIQGHERWSLLSRVEHPLAVRIAEMQRIGMPFDFAWAERAEEHFDQDLDVAEHQLVQTYGITPANQYAHSSKTALMRRFEEYGVRWSKKTKGGQDSLDKEVLKDLSCGSGEAAALARAVLDAKRAKHYGDYVRTMRDHVGMDGRVHPNIHPMQAATTRMSVSDPALQQLPRDDVWIRGCLLPDPGEAVVCADYAQVEFRVGAAASQDPVMIRKIQNGEDLHANTATALFGLGFTKAQRQCAKAVGFGRLYLGSPAGIRRQMLESDTTGEVPSLSAVRKATGAFDREFVRYNRWAMSLKTATAANEGRLLTMFRRPLIVDKAYAAPNYYIQSSARDLFAAGLTRAHQAGLGSYLRLVVHDEVVASIPPDQVDSVLPELEQAFTTTLRGVPIEVESEVKGERWRK